MNVNINFHSTQFQRITFLYTFKKKLYIQAPEHTQYSQIITRLYNILFQMDYTLLFILHTTFDSTHYYRFYTLFTPLQLSRSMMARSPFSSMLTTSRASVRVNSQEKWTFIVTIRCRVVFCRNIFSTFCVRNKSIISFDVIRSNHWLYIHKWNVMRQIVGVQSSSNCDLQSSWRIGGSSSQ